MSQMGFGRALKLVLSCCGIASLLLVACVSDNPGPGGPTCESYCSAVAKRCDGDKAQYRSAEECAKACALLPLGTAGDGDINSIGCRLRKAESATTIDECIAAGPFGGGVCGDRCTSFCMILTSNCKDEPNPVFNSEATCNEQCPKFDPTLQPGETEGPKQLSSRNNLNCRMQHTILSLGDPVTHCPHPGESSPVCNQ